MEAAPAEAEVGANDPPPPSPSTARSSPKPVTRILTVRLVEVNRLNDIDIINQRFSAEFFVQLAFEGGALDEDLSRPGAVFPFDDSGRPTFRPSAEWFMAQVDFNNAHDYKTLDAKVVQDGDDLLMNMRFEGCFSEIMELESFPCDIQDLTMSLSINVRTTGPLPVRIRNSPDMKTSIAPDAFVDGKMWDLHPELDIVPGEYGVVEDRKFPALQMIVLVGRRPTFYAWNLALPMCLFVPMCLLTFCVKRDNIGERLGVSLAIVLTAIAHKYSMTSLVPSVSYLTFLDKYTLFSLSIIYLITLFGAVVGALEAQYCRWVAIYADVNETAAYEATESGRRLIGRASASNSGSASGASDVALRRAPIGYTDEDTCPFTAEGRTSMFDVMDQGLWGLFFVLWLTLQLWAWIYYRRECNQLEQRIERINRRCDVDEGAKAGSVVVQVAEVVSRAASRASTAATAGASTVATAGGHALKRAASSANISVARYLSPPISPTATPVVVNRGSISNGSRDDDPQAGGLRQRAKYMKKKFAPTFLTKSIGARAGIT